MIASDKLGKDCSEFFGGNAGLFLEAEEGGDFGGGFGEGESEFAVIHLLVGGHEEIEIEGQVFGGDVEDDADGDARDSVFAAEARTDMGFHFDGVGMGALPASASSGGGVVAAD